MVIASPALKFSHSHFSLIFSLLWAPMIPLQVHHLTPPLSISQTTPPYTRPSLPHLLSPFSQRINFSLKPNLFTFSPILLSKPNFKLFRASESRTLIYGNEDEEATGISTDLDDLSPNGVVYRKTLALVECSMLAALTGLVYFLSNSLAIEVRGVGLKFGFFSIYMDEFSFNILDPIAVIWVLCFKLCLVIWSKFIQKGMNFLYISLLHFDNVCNLLHLLTNWVWTFVLVTCICSLSFGYGAELLCLLLFSANSDHLDEMGHRSWKKNYGLWSYHVRT